MTKLNLYEIYDKSLADLNKDYIDTLSLYEDSYQVKLPQKRRPLTVVFSVILMVASLVASGYYLFHNRLIPIESIIAKVRDLRSPEELQGYVRVQIFEFDDNSSVTAELPIDNITIPAILTDTDIAKLDTKDLTPKRADVYRKKAIEVQAMQDPVEGKIPDNADDIKIVAINKDDKIPVEEYAKKGDDTYKEALKLETERLKRLKENKIIATKKPLIDTNNYYILFENITEAQYKKVNNIMGTSSLLLASDMLAHIQPVWRVYKVDEAGSITIGDKTVTFVSEFMTSNDASEFATYLQGADTQVIVRSEDKKINNYTIKICCTNIDEAKSIAQASNIRDKIIKIVKDQ